MVRGPHSGLTFPRGSKEEEEEVVAVLSPVFWPRGIFRGCRGRCAAIRSSRAPGVDLMNQFRP
jgi:hypothetical protein